MVVRLEHTHTHIECKSYFTQREYGNTCCMMYEFNGKFDIGNYINKIQNLLKKKIIKVDADNHVSTSTMISIHHIY